MYRQLNLVSGGIIHQHIRNVHS